MTKLEIIQGFKALLDANWPQSIEDIAEALRKADVDVDRFNSLSLTDLLVALGPMTVGDLFIWADFFHERKITPPKTDRYYKLMRIIEARICPDANPS